VQKYGHFVLPWVYEKPKQYTIGFELYAYPIAVRLLTGNQYINTAPNGCLVLVTCL
jgi:hypothetical protein